MTNSKRKLHLLATSAVVAAGLSLTTQAAKAADTLVVTNFAAFGDGPITTVDITNGTFVNSFIPDQAQIGSANGRAVQVLGNYVYYTELTGGFGPSTGIYVAPFNGGAGGHDILAQALPNPAPGTGIVNMASDDMGHLYVKTNYPAGPQFVQDTDGDGHNIGAPVTLFLSDGVTPIDGGSDGFAILPNGNWLINLGDAVNDYYQFNSTTGVQIPGTEVIAHDAGGACSDGTGNATDGTHLFFDCNFNTIVEDDMMGNYITSVSNGGPPDGESISLIEAAPITPPAIPEPSTWAMLLLGFAGLGFAGSRKAKGAAVIAA